MTKKLVEAVEEKVLPAVKVAPSKSPRPKTDIFNEKNAN